VIPSVAVRYGGPSQAVVALSRALRSRGVETLIATTDADGPTRLDVRRGEPTIWSGEPVIFFRRQASEALKLSLRLSSWLRTNVSRFDVVHVHAVFSHACVAAGAAAARAAVPYVVRPLGTLDPRSLRQKPLRKRLFLRAGAARLLRDAAAVHYTTPAEKQLAESALALGRGVVIPNGVDDALVPGPVASAALPCPPPYVLALGRLHEKKGLDVLIHAFGSTDAARSGARLVVAGDGEPPYVAHLHALARNVCPAGSVVFAGWIAGDARVSAFRGAALVALPSRQENFGLAVAEAMACGTAVVVGPAVNLAPDIERVRAGWVVPVEASALARALDEALSDPAERRRRGAAGAALVDERFRWPKVAQRVEALYRELMSR
jgi:glycosyltransferase involved in cell wall biosynthesis